MLNTQQTRKHQAGLTLVETIVGLLLIASCTIGIAAIYAQRQNIARGGRLHENAVALAQQMATAIHNSSDAATNFETTMGATCNNPSSQSSDSKRKQDNHAVNIVACWQDAVEQELTNGSANISLDRTSVPAQYVIIVSWSEPHSGTASYVLRVTPGLGKPEAAPAKPADAVRAAG